MKQIVFLSGKGGTGKTTFSSSLASLIEGVVAADCDVDGSNMPIALGGEIIKREEFHGMPRVKIDPLMCSRCGLCERLCQFDAIKPPYVKIALCEGCMVCLDHCPCKAISENDITCGLWYISRIRNGLLVHARLNPGEENSGKLVNKVRSEARRICSPDGIIVIDGPPGIGCPAISSLTGCDLAVIVAEPSYSSLHDMDRLLRLCGMMGVKAVGTINKHDLARDISGQIEGFFIDKGIKLCGKLSFSEELPSLQKSGVPPVISGSKEVTEQLKGISMEILEQAGIDCTWPALSGKWQQIDFSS